MSIQTPLDIYSNILIKNLEHIQNKALVIAPFEITKSGKLDPDLLLDTPGIININIYKKIVDGEDKEPTANQFKTIKSISELDSSNRISTFNIPVIFKYDKETGIRTIEKDLTLLLNDPDYMDLIIDIQNVDLSSETGSNGFYCVCQVQKILKPAATTTFTEVANDEFLFMIPSIECEEIPEADEFDLLDTDNKVINIKKIEAPGFPDLTKQGYRIYPVIKIPETTTTPKYYLGSKYQRNIMDVLAPALKSKRTIFNLKDMYLVDDLCIQTLKKINILLENNQMIKFSERLYNLATPLTPLKEKLNADLILEYLSTPVSGSYSNDLEVTLKTSLLEDYNFTQEEIDNLNDNLNTFKSRARIALATPTIDNDKFRFDLPNTFIDGNRSKTEKKNLLVFGTDAGFNKFGLSGYSEPYSNISKRDTSEVLDLDDLTTGLTTLSSLNYNETISHVTVNIPIIFAKTTDTGVTDISSNVQKAPGLLSDVDANGIRGIYSNINADSYSAANNFNFGTGDFTIEFDLKSTISQENYFFSIGQYRSACNLGIFFKSDNSLLFRAGTNSWGWDLSGERSTPAGSILPGVYYHVVFQRTNGVLDIYIDGVKIHTSAWVYNIGATGNIWFGSYFGTGGHTNYRFNNFEVYKRAKYTGNFNIKTRYGLSNEFKSILTNYKQQIPFTYIPLSTDIDDINIKPVFDNLTDITGFYKNNKIIIDIPNTL